MKPEPSDEKNKSNLPERVAATLRDLGALSSEAADPALRARIDAAVQALHGNAPAPRNTALLENGADSRALVRDVVAEELTRYWERRFGGRP